MSANIIPYKTFAYYQAYVQTADRIINGHDKPSLYRIYAFQSILMIYFLNLFYSQLTQTPDDVYHAFVHADIVFYAFWPDFRYFMLLNAVPTSLMIFYAYVWVPGRFIRFCQREFIETTAEESDIQLKVQQFAVKLVNGQQSFILGLVAFLAQFHVILVLEAVNYRHHLFTSWEGLTDLLLHSINSILLDISYAMWANILILSASLALSLVYYLQQLFRDNLRRLRSIDARLIRLTDFIQRDSLSLIRIRLVDQFVGPQMSIFLLLNCPINAYLIMIILLDVLPSNPMIRIAIYLLVIAQMFGNFALHGIFGHFSKLVHRSGKPLLSLAAAQAKNAKFKTVANLRARILLTLIINRVHSRTRYGIHYGPFGLITLASFSKCCLLYGEFLMYSYKIIKGIN